MEYKLALIIESQRNLCFHRKCRRDNTRVCCWSVLHVLNVQTNQQKKKEPTVGVRFSAFAFIIFQINWMNKAKLGHRARIMAMAAICFG